MKSKGGVSNEISGVALNSLEYMERAHKEGATVLMMIDSQMFENVVSSSYMDLLTKSHWIVYEGGLTFLDDNNKPVKSFENATKLFFKFATWESCPHSNCQMLSKHDNISVGCFKSTFYGFIVCRKKMEEKQ